MTTPVLEEIAAPTRVEWVRPSTGVRYTLRNIDGFRMQMVKRSQNVTDPVEILTLGAKIISPCLGLSFDEVFGTEDNPGFTPEEVAEVLAILIAPVMKVEESAPPFSQPAGETATV